MSCKPQFLRAILKKKRHSKKQNSKWRGKTTNSIVKECTINVTPFILITNPFSNSRHTFFSCTETRRVDNYLLPATAISLLAARFSGNYLFSGRALSFISGYLVICHWDGLSLTLACLIYNWLGFYCWKPPDGVRSYSALQTRHLSNIWKESYH